jgi:hypothetical protein
MPFPSSGPSSDWIVGSICPRGQMRVQCFAAVAMLFALPMLGSATSYVVPTTTLAAQTSNNTSATNGFSSQSNGNRGAGNVSKIDVHSLLYAGATTKVYASLMLWFGQSNHMNIGYSSTDPAQIKSQVEDMISRGINGVIIAWYGPNNAIDQATKLLMAEAENHPGFTFMIMIDQGAIEWDSCAGCAPQQTLVNQLQYIEQTYFPSPAYMTVQGQPVVTNFDIDLYYSVDWNAANAALSTHPLFLFQNNKGFSQTLSGGGYSWVIPTTTDYGMAYLSSFYGTGMLLPSEQTVGATYKGFNDTLASWGSNRIMRQQCGQTWLQTFSEINGLYNSGKQLPDLQLVTWNDYEEGTEIESGIDNCVTLSASVTANALQWTISGNENTIDHYTVYISTDGQNLMSLTDMTAGLHSLDLCGFPIPPDNYTLYVQAMGKASMANQMSGAVGYSPACSSGPPAPVPPSLSLSASPSSVTIPAGQSGNLTVTVKPQSGTFSSPVSLFCTGLPTGWSCSFSPASMTVGSNPVNSTLTIVGVSGTAMNSPLSRKSTPLYAAWLLSLGIAGFAFMGIPRGRRSVRTLALCAVIGLGMGATSCAGVSAVTKATPAPTPTPVTYAVTINGSSGSSQCSTTVNVIVQ